MAQSSYTEHEYLFTKCRDKRIKRHSGKDLEIDV
jgi:hypothetical protein